MLVSADRKETTLTLFHCIQHFKATVIALVGLSATPIFIIEDTFLKWPTYKPKGSLSQGPIWCVAILRTCPRQNQECKGHPNYSVEKAVGPVKD